MNNEFDELARNMGQSGTRRQALQRFGLVLAGIALGMLGVADKAEAARPYYHCNRGRVSYGCEKRYPNDFGNCICYCSARCGGFGC